MASETHPELAQSFDASSPEQVEKAKLASARREKEQRDFLAELLSTKQGKAWMWETLGTTGIFTTSYVAGDPGAMAFNEGRRNVGLYLLAQITAAAPDALIQMMKLAKARLDA